MYNKILITGGHGFVGKNLVGYLSKHLDHPNVKLCVPTKEQMDILSPKDLSETFFNFRPDCVINLAAVCGGIGANQNAPGDFILYNLKFGLNLIDTIRLHSPDAKLIQVGSICAYPKYCTVPFKEGDLWNGYPEETNAPYGIAKKTITELTLALHAQYGFNCVNLYPVNLYGPQDSFDLNTSHVIPAIIRKVDHAKQNNENEVVFWGTGSATRDFLYVKDFCQAVKAAIIKEPGPEPINIGTETELPIKYIVAKICEIMKYDGDIFWDDSKPDGQPRRCVSIQRAKERLDYLPEHNIITGLHHTIEWYEKYKEYII